MTDGLQLGRLLCIGVVGGIVVAAGVVVFIEVSDYP